jgi:hypothetical protein
MGDLSKSTALVRQLVRPKRIAGYRLFAMVCLVPSKLALATGSIRLVDASG